MPGNSISIDLAQARQLADLISAAVAQLEGQSALASARNADTDGAHEGGAQDKARKPLLMIASAAGQLVALAKPPSVYVAELATGVSTVDCLLSPIYYSHLRIAECVDRRRADRRGGICARNHPHPQQYSDEWIWRFVRPARSRQRDGNHTRTRRLRGICH